MKCIKRGAELEDGTSFCANCGAKIANDDNRAAEQPIMPQHVNESRESTTLNTYSSRKSIKENIAAFWSKMSLYSKINAALILVLLVLLIIALCIGNRFAIAFSIVQIAGTVVAMLMHKGIIPIQKWVKYLVSSIVLVLIVPNIFSYSWMGKSSENNITYTSSGSESETVSEIPEVVTVKAPYEAEQCLGKNYLDIIYGLENAGFVNIKTDVIEDLDTLNSDKVDTIESITIGGNTGFVNGSEYDRNDEVFILYHAYKKYDVSIHVDFESNLIFSTYDVNILLNGNKKGTMKHGENKDLHFSLEPGDYTITFESADSSDVNGETVLTVDCDIEASYHISCHRDNVSVETQYIDRQVELAEGEIKLNTSADDFKFKDYTEVESALKELGFSNIKYEILYDIVLGFTPSGEVKNVSIAGNSSFARGDVFPSDAEIIITYHMPENDDPSRITVPSDSSSYIGMNYLDVQQEFQGFGFTNIELEEQITHDSTYSDGQVSLVELDGRSFDAGDNFKPGTSIIIKYYHIDNITVENNSDFSALMSITNTNDPIVKQFVKSYNGKVVEFDGCIALLMPHENYTTRFDIALAGGDYYADRLYGPLWSFENVNYFDMNVTGADSVVEGMNFHITAKITGYSDEGNYIILDPISLVVR